MANYLWLYGFVSEDCKSHFLPKICAVWRDQCSSPSLISRAATRKLTAEGWGRLAPWRGEVPRDSTERQSCFPIADVIVALSSQRSTWRNMETVDQLLQGMLCLILRCDISTSTQFSLFAAWTIFRHISYHVCHDRTMMTSETSENTIRFSFTLFKVDRLQIIVVAKNITVLQLFISRMPKMCAIPQLVSAPFSDFTIRIV